MVQKNTCVRINWSFWTKKTNLEHLTNILDAFYSSARNKDELKKYKQDLPLVKFNLGRPSASRTEKDRVSCIWICKIKTSKRERENNMEFCSFW
jgi:hypothetical protein